MLIQLTAKINPENVVPFSLGNETSSKTLSSECMSEREEMIFVHLKHCLSGSQSAGVLFEFWVFF